jgi:hypothetical protein
MPAKRYSLELIVVTLRECAENQETFLLGRKHMTTRKD